jgi:S1-C subfamily serine protease
MKLNTLRVTAAAAVAVVLFGLAQAARAQTEPWRLGVKITRNAGGGVYVSEVFPNSPAEQLGMRPGNVLLTVDGVLYNDPLQVRDKIMLNSGDQITIVYQDGSQFYEKTAQLDVVAVAADPGVDTYGAKPKAAQKVPMIKILKSRKVTDPRKR